MKVESLLKVGTVAALLACVLAPTPAQALGVGPYVFGGAGQVKDDYASANYNFGGIGLALDTAVAEDTLFNYRLQLGYARVSFEHGDTDGNRFEMRHIFGFGVLRTKEVRLWLGPQIGLYYDDESYASYVGANIGPALGVNVQFGPVVSLAVTAFGGYGAYTNTSRNDDSSKDHGTEWQAGVNLAVLFRFGEGK